MKKRVFFAILISFLLIFSSFSVTSFAAERSTEEKKTEDLIKDFESVIPSESGISADGDALIERFGFEGILRGIIDELRNERNATLGFFFTVIGFCILSVLCEGLSFSERGGDKAVGAALFTVMSLSMYPKIYSVFFSVKESLEAISVFFGAALPVMTAITVASGSVKSAGVQAMNMNITLGIIGTVASKILLPLSLGLLALALVSSFADGAAGSVSKSVKSLFNFGLGIVTAIASATVALQSVVASAADSAAIRAARYAAGGLIPVVGSSVSSALSTLAGGLAYAKSTVGAASIAVISVMAIAPLVLLLTYRMIFSIAVNFMEYMDNSHAIRCFSAYRTAFDTVISVYVMSTLVCIIQIIVFIKGGAQQI